MAPTVAVLVGSLRKESFNKKLAAAIAKAAEGKFTTKIVEIGDLPFYNEDIEAAGAPESWQRFREAVKSADAVLFVTPEYNRSLPAVIKNAIDVGSRPWGKSVWSGKPGAIVASSIGGLGGFNASQHVRQSVGVLGVNVLSLPEMYLAHIHTWFDEAGAIKEEGPRKLVDQFVTAFAAWIEKVR